MLKFRERKIGFISDIRKAFQMIEVHEHDRDALRFLWWKNKDMKELKELRHVRVPFGATCSPFILGAVIEHHLKSNSSDQQEIVNRLWEYVDNCCSSENSIEEYQRFRKESVDILADAKMDLRMWLSNFEDLDNPETRCISVLGLKWDRKTDELYLDIKEISIREKVTKREILSVISKVFDPLGIAAPALLPMKLLLQRTWVNKVKWDDELSGPEEREFREWCDSLNCLREKRIPRLISGDSPDHSLWELHTMSDGSKYAYGAICFLRTCNGEQVFIQMLAAKSRVARLTTLTIPRMELMGCLIGARICAQIKEALKIHNAKEYYWTDSSTALAWILRNDQWGTFVGNRTKEIRKLTCSRDWRHLPGVANPADLPSRGCSPRALKDSQWWKGPKWLFQNKDKWPRLVEEFNEEEIGLEQKKGTTPKEVMLNVVLDFGKQYSFSTLVRIQAWVRRYLANLRKEKRTGRLTKAELMRAEIDVILKIQDEAFASEEGLARLKTLETFKDEYGIIRVKTRLLNLDDDKMFRFPAVLPGDHSTVKQLIWDYYIGYCHGGVGFIMVKLREKYWILKSRQNVKKVVTRCYRCRKLSAKKTVTESAPLPLNRIRSAEVFEVVGIDLAGPFLLKNGKKVWLILYTCAVYRAVHITVINSLTTAAFLRSLHQFVERYRRPITIYSDNGTNFRGAHNLFRALYWKSIQEEEEVSHIEWKFNQPTASWWGGWWDRLIRTIKDLIRKEIGNAVLNQEQLAVVVNRVEEVMNDQPLTYVSENLEDLEPLAPAMFLNPLGITKFPEAERIDGEELRSRFKYVTMVKRDLKIRFKKDYIALLVSRNSKKGTRPLKVGELVVVAYDNKKRSQWPLGRILELMPGADGVALVAKVKTRAVLLIRPVQRLHALEADNLDPICKMGEPKSRFGRLIKRPERIDL